MCDFEKGFVLCKCADSKSAVHNKKSRRYKRDKSIHYSWHLNKYKGKSNEMEMGRYALPQDDIGLGLSSKFVLSQLNNRNCFDFKYQPTEGDNLRISNQNKWERLEFIYKNGKWIEDHYSPFDHVLETISNGSISTSKP